MIVAAGVHPTSGSAKAAGHWIVDFRGTVAVPAGNQHAPIVEQRRRMSCTRLLHLRPGREFAGLRIKEFGRVERSAARVGTATCYQHPAVL